jgi:nicotinate-nucleotide--dimethylbenzimidazole phosphoribosyltransferase
VNAIETGAVLAAHARQARLAKPAGSLGRLEEIACWFAARLGEPAPLMPRAEVFVFAGDHGVASRGISAFPQAVTAQMVENFARGGAAINVLTRLEDVPLHVVDVGVASERPTPRTVRQERIRRGTRDLSVEAAMTADEAANAIAVGRRCARESIGRGTRLLIAGDMGIGNTTAAAALICAFTGLAACEVVGSGSGVDAHGLERKRHAVDAALKRLRTAQIADPVRVLAQLGGFEIAAIAGCYLEAAALSVSVLLDGFVTTAAALAAVAIDAGTRDWLLAAHVSAERGHRAALRALALEPILDLRMRLGEASGAALALPLIRAALALHREMATFEEADVSSCVTAP